MQPRGGRRNRCTLPTPPMPIRIPQGSVHSSVHYIINQLHRKWEEMEHLGQMKTAQNVPSRERNGWNCAMVRGVAFGCPFLTSVNVLGKPHRMKVDLLALRENGYGDIIDKK